MVHSNVVSAAVNGASSAPSATSACNWPFRTRHASTGSFHAGDIIPSFDYDPYERPEHPSRRRSVSTRRHSIVRYHTFPTSPPKAPSDDATLDDGDSTSSTGGYRGHRPRRVRRERRGADDDDDNDNGNGLGSSDMVTPLPLRQVGLLAILSLAEQTALNSIAPYLPVMVSSFHEIPKEQMGLYVGLLASAFAMAQLTTNLLWGYLSDIVGRKPIMLAGTFLLMLCFICFGFCTTYWQVVVVHVAMGLLNGNAAVVPTCLGEVTDRTNQSSVFTWLPVIYSIGSITGPALGGLLVGGPHSKYPFYGPNMASAVLLGLSVVALALWFDETLEGVDDPSVMGGLKRLFYSCMPARRRPRGADRGCSSGSAEETDSLFSPRSQMDDIDEDGESTSLKGPESKSVIFQLLNYKTVLLLLTYLMFQLSNISFNSLYPIFSAAPEPTGRHLAPGDIGLLLSFAGVVTIVFQLTVFQPLRAKMGNLGTYRIALLGLAVTMLAMPWVGHVHDKPLFGFATGEWWLHMEMAAVLAVKNICAVGGLSSVMLLITNSAPSHETLGTLNGIAQTLSAAGRSVGPFVSGALFTISTQIHPKGELLVWGVFGGVAVFGWLGGLMAEGRGLESAGWEEEDDELTDEEDN